MMALWHDMMTWWHDVNINSTICQQAGNQSTTSKLGQLQYMYKHQHGVIKSYTTQQQTIDYLENFARVSRSTCTIGLFGSQQAQRKYWKSHVTSLWRFIPSRLRLGSSSAISSDHGSSCTRLSSNPDNQTAAAEHNTISYSVHWTLPRQYNDKQREK